MDTYPCTLLPRSHYALARNDTPIHGLARALTALQRGQAAVAYVHKPYGVHLSGQVLPVHVHCPCCNMDTLAAIR